MLSHTDIHYLVGLLTKASGSEDIEVELGDMVFDAAANKPRDVDVTVKQKNGDGTLNVYQGIEVKDEAKPLDVKTVEQLCLKLQDMPSITHRGIVSASGYSSGAVEKAAAHDMKLFEIVDWEPAGVEFGNIIFANDFTSGIKETVMDGDRVTEVIQHSLVWKMLREHATEKPIAACGMVTLRNGSLQGLSVVGAKGTIGALTISHSDRATGRIYRKTVS